VPIPVSHKVSNQMHKDGQSLFNHDCIASGQSERLGRERTDSFGFDHMPVSVVRLPESSFSHLCWN
jgi:hypothetical protein